jgi:hypothetical protein
MLPSEPKLESRRSFSRRKTKMKMTTKTKKKTAVAAEKTRSLLSSFLEAEAIVPAPSSCFGFP